MEPLGNLNIELQGKDFERSLLPEGQQLLQITAAVLELNKRGDNYNLHITATNVNPTPSSKEGVVIDAGSAKLQSWDNVIATDNQKEKGVDPLETICAIFDAAFGCTPDERPNLNQETVSTMVGSQVIGIIRHENDDVFGQQSRIVKYLAAS